MATPAVQCLGSVQHYCKIIIELSISFTAVFYNPDLKGHSFASVLTDSLL